MIWNTLTTSMVTVIKIGLNPATMAIMDLKTSIMCSKRMQKGYFLVLPRPKWPIMVPVYGEDMFKQI